MTIIKNGNGYFIPSNEMPVIRITSNPKLQCLVSFKSIVIEVPSNHTNLIDSVILNARALLVFELLTILVYQ